MMIMKNKSIWMDEKSNNCKSVKKNMEVDVLIVGGGITGISVLHELQNYNLKTILVERNICGFGITSKSTAKITYLQESIYMNIRKSSYELASLYLKSQIDAVNRLKDIINEESIDCNLKEVSSYVFTNDEDNLTKLEEDYNFYTDNNVEAEYVTEIDDLDVLKGIKVPDTYVFHPLKYINYLKNKYMDMIYEIMLKLGVPLTYSVGKIEVNGKTAYTVGDDCLLLICLAEDVRPEDVEAMAEYAPAKVIIARDSFSDDTAMANAHYILRDRGIELKLV